MSIMSAKETRDMTMKGAPASEHLGCISRKIENAAMHKDFDVTYTFANAAENVVYKTIESLEDLGDRVELIDGPEELTICIHWG